MGHQVRWIFQAGAHRFLDQHIIFASIFKQHNEIDIKIHETHIYIYTQVVQITTQIRECFEHITFCH